MAEPASRARRISKVVGRLLLWGVGILAGLLVLAWLGLLLFFPDDKIRRLLCEKLGVLLGVPVEASRLDLSIFKGIELRDLRIGAPAGYPEAPFALGGLRLEYSLPDLLRGRIHLGDVELLEPRLRLSCRQGTCNLGSWLTALSREEPPAGRQTVDTKPPWLELERFRISDAVVEIETEALRANISGLQLTAALKLTPRRLAALQLEIEQEEPFRLEMNLPASVGRLQVEGTAAATLRLDGQRIFFQGALRAPLLVLQRSGRSEPHRLEAEFSGWLAQEMLFATGDHSAAGRWPGPGRLEQVRIVFDGEPVLSLSAEVEPARELPAQLGLELSLPSWLVEYLAQTVGLEASGRLGLSAGHLLLDAAGRPRRAAGLLTAESWQGRWPTISFAGAAAKLHFDWAQEDGVSKLEAMADLHAEQVNVAGVRLSRPALSLGGRASTEATGDLNFGASPLSVQLTVEEFRHPGTGWQGAWTKLRANLERCTFSPPASLHCGSANFDLRLERPRRAEAGGEKLALEMEGQTITAEPAAEGARLQVENLQAKLSAGRLAAGGLFLEGAKLGLRAPELRLARGEASLARGAELALEAATLRHRDVTVERLNASGTMASWRSDSGATAFSLSGRAGFLQIAPLAAAGWNVPEPWQLEFSGRWGRRLEVSNLEVTAGNVLRLMGHGWYELASGGLAGQLKLKDIELERVSEFLPASLRQGLPRLSGTVQAQVSLEKTVEISKRVNDWPQARVAVSLSGIAADWPVVELKLRSLEGQAEALLQLPEPLPAQASLDLRSGQLQIGDLASFTSSEWTLVAESKDERIGLKGTAKLLGATVGDVGATGLEEIQLAMEAGWLGRKELALERVLLQVPRGGLSLEASGKALWGAGRSWGHLARLSGRAQLAFASPQPFRWGACCSGQGGAALELQVELEKELLRADGAVSLEDFSLVIDDLQLSRANGKFPLAMRARWDGGPRWLGEESLPVASGLAYRALLDPLKSERHLLQASRLQLEDLLLENLRAGATFRQGVLEISGLHLGFLGGDMVADARLVLLPPERRALHLEAEMSGVDLTRLPSGQARGDGVVGGSLRLDVDIGKRQFSTALELHRIGAGALLALLAAADPNRKEEGLQGVRELLERYGVAPRRLRLQVRHGLLDLEILFDLGATARTAARLVRGFAGNTFRMRNLPVSPLLGRLFRAAPDSDAH